MSFVVKATVLDPHALPRCGTLLCDVIYKKDYLLSVFFESTEALSRKVDWKVFRYFGGQYYRWATDMSIEEWNEVATSTDLLFAIASKMVAALEDRYPELKVV